MKGFNIGISSDSAVDVALMDPEGKEVERRNNLQSKQLFSGSRADASNSEIWSLDFSHPIWIVYLHMYAPLVPVVSTNPNTLLQAKK